MSTPNCLRSWNHSRVTASESSPYSRSPLSGPGGPAALDSSASRLRTRWSSPWSASTSSSRGRGRAGTGPARHGAVEQLGGAGHQQLGDRVHVPGPPRLQRGTGDDPVERAHRRAAVDLVVDLLAGCAGQGRPGRFREVPPEHQGHPDLRATLRPLDVLAAVLAQVLARLVPHLREGAAEVALLDRGTGGRVDVV